MNYGIFKKSDPETFIQVGAHGNPALLESRLPAELGILFSEKPISDVEHKNRNGKVAARTKADVDARVKKLNEKPAQGLTKLERILKHLKSQGIDLGPDGDYL